MAFVPYRPPVIPPEEMRQRGQAFFEGVQQRRSVRYFADTPVDRELVELAIQAASTGPSGAHRQPWTFVAVGNPEIKRKIREAAEGEERRNYEGGRMPEAWLEALKPFGTTWQKPYLETVPWLVAVFARPYDLGPEGGRIQNYYVRESVGIACGMFLTALHEMGLATLTHTPSPMKFLCEILERPKNEQAFMLFPVGLPAGDCVVPDLQRKSLDQVAVFVE